MGRWAIINVLLALVVLLLGVEIVRTWARAVPTVEPPARAPVPERGEKGKHKAAGRPGAPAPQAAPALVASIADKDLFDPSRRAPTEEVKVEAPKESGPPAGITVNGVRIYGKDREVFVTDASQGNAQKRLRVGDQVVGYTIKSIEPSALTLTAPSGDPVTMLLEVDKGKAAAPPRAPGGRPGQPPVANAAGAPSPAAGIQPPQAPKAPQPVLVPGARPGAPGAPGAPAAPGAPNPQVQQQMPAEVRQKLDQLKKQQQDSTPRLGHRR